MANKKLIRSDEWRLSTDLQTMRMAEDTVAIYRRMTNALCTVLLAHWPEVCHLPVQDLESYFHTTKQTPLTKYGAWFKKNFYKFPAYLRRAATMAAHGDVSSFITRYRKWQGSERKKHTNRPPKWSPPNMWPVFYTAKGGADAMLSHDGDKLIIKLLDKKSGDWLWREISVLKRGRRHNLLGALPKSPALIVRGSKLSLAQPYEFKKPKVEKTKNSSGQVCLQMSSFDAVCSVDQGMNKQAVCSIVLSDGTVLARKFISQVMHIDRRDKVLWQIRDKARHTMGKGGKFKMLGFVAVE